jgi:hypothetical protein
MKTSRSIALVVALLVLVAVVLAGYGVRSVWWHAHYYVTEHTDYDPPPQDELKLEDDKLDAKKPALDETLVDSRPLGDWELNASAAVTRLDCPILRPDQDAELLALRPSYAKAVEAAKLAGATLLPSANLLDGAAKQFDDGLYAAVDLACYEGRLGTGPPAPKFIRAVFDKLPKNSPARPFLAAALELAGETVELTAAEADERESLLREFQGNPTRSKPISFYTWTPQLGRVWRFYRFLQREFGDQELAVPGDVAAVLKNNPDLLAQYRAINGFYGRLTNPVICLPADVLIDAKEGLDELARKHHARRAFVAVFPPGTSRETELFDRMFPEGVPPSANLMGELIRRIRSGEVKLEPLKDDGWYQYQVYALETLLLPSKGQEEGKLLLTAAYKKRLVEAFKALITKRRETHARQLGMACGLSDERVLGDGEIRPRLRIEPCATYYLRTARAYAFVENFLAAAAGRERLAGLHGLKEGGQRGPNLADELAAVRLRFYGFYLIACEDIGMRPQLLPDEPVDRPAAMKAAMAWLDNLENDPDLACDTRVSIPIFVNLDPLPRKTRLWATLGVRLARLEASYARPPKVRPGKAGGPWKDVDSYQLGNSQYVIAVDEFAEIELDGYRAMTRAEFRAACDRHKTKDAIVSALSGRRSEE